MGVTISINGLSLIHEDSNGASTATLPNVCHTPSAGPIPYGSVAFSRDLVGGTRSVRVDGGHSAATARSVFGRSTGDEAGLQGGLASGVHGAESSFLTASPDVRIEGSPAARLTDKMLNNHGNTINAGGDTNDPVGRKRREPRANEVEKVQITVLGEGSKRVHAPVTVVLRPVKKGKRYTLTSTKDKGPITFYNVVKAKYRVIVIHDCYPEGIVEHDVKDKLEKVKVQLMRPKLLDAAHHRGVRLGVRFSNPNDPTNKDEPPHRKGAKDQFDDILGGIFWSGMEGQRDQFSIAGRVSAPMIEARNAGMGIELTPLFWLFGFAGDNIEVWKKSKKKTKSGKVKVTWKQAAPRPIEWGPNPGWARGITDVNEAMGCIKNFITRLVTGLDQLDPEHPIVPHVKRWVVINEPMNILMRDVTRTAPFLNTVMPTVPDPNHAKKDMKKLKHQHDRPPVLVKLAPQAIDNMVAILQHAHVTIPNDSLLIVNDYGIEGYDEKGGLTGLRGFRFRELMQGILDRVKDPALLKRLRVGLQGHLNSGGELDTGSKTKAASARKELESRGERNDFRVSSVRKQMQWFKSKGLRVCVTECDLVLPTVTYEVKVPGKKKLKTLEALDEHIRLGTHVVTENGKPKIKKKPGFSAHKFFNSKLRRRPYLDAFAKQRIQQRDLINAILGSGNVDSFSWWDFDDDLPEDHAGSNFRYHGYLFHEHLVCKHCKNHPAMQVADETGILYKKPSYWGTVAAFLNSSGSGF